MLIHFVDDAFCNAVMYPTLYKRLALGMEAPPSGEYCCRVQSFYSANVPGDHDRGKILLSALLFDDLEDGCVNSCWRALMGASA